MKSIMVTGGLGFIGFNAVQLWKRDKRLEEEGVRLVVVDKETYAAQFMLGEKKRWCQENGVPCVRCDICDQAGIEAVVKEHDVDTIVNFAAESHVDNSISGPEVFFRTNVLGTEQLLEVAARHGLRFHQVGTDEVYGETTPEFWAENEEFAGSPELAPLRPSSPYSSSKAAADLAVLAWCRTYGLRATVSRCTNNFGPWQHPEKLIGTVVSKAVAGEGIPVYGDGMQRRHWIHVDEHNRAIMRILERDAAGHVYNISPPAGNWVANVELVKSILSELGVPESRIQHVKDRPGHDVTYFLASEGISRSDRPWTADMPATVEWMKSTIEVSEIAEK